MYLTMFAVMLAAVVGYTDCHLSNTEQTTKPMSIELINPKPLHEINALPSLICIEPYDTHFCLNGGRCFNITVATYSFPSCECAIGYMGERCERKYLNRSYNPEHYMKADDIVTSQNRSNVDKSYNSHNSINIVVTEIYVGSSAERRVAITVILLVVMLLMHLLVSFIVAV